MTMMKTRSLLLVVSFFLLYSSIQAGKIEGTITLTDKIKPVQGANVYLEKTSHGAISNGNGRFTIKNVPAGKYKLIVSNIGYETIKKEIHLAEGDTIKTDFRIVETVTTLDEVVIMTNGIKGLEDIPGSAHYISPGEIQQFSYTDINRTLRSVPGINLMEEDGFGLRPNIGLRGTGVERASKITVMEDGVLVAPAPYAAPAAYYFPTIGRMQGVEVLKGSSQIKYGPYTTGGAINLISTRIPDDFSGRLNLLTGSFDTKNLHAHAGNSNKNFAYLVETFQYWSDGYKELDGAGNTGFDKKDYLGKFRVNTNPEAPVYQSLTFKIGQTNETSNETYLGLTGNDFDSNPYRRYAASAEDQMNTKHAQFSLTHLARFSEAFKITTTAYHSDFARNWYKLDKVQDSEGNKTGISDLLESPGTFAEGYDILTGTTSSLSDALFVKANNRTYFARGIQGVIDFKFENGEVGHYLDMGFRYHQDEIDRFQWVDEYFMNNGVMQLTEAGVPGTESNRIAGAAAFAAYLQYKVKYNKFTLTPGLRFENIQLEKKDFGKNDPARVGVDLKENRNHVDVFIPGIALDYQHDRYLSVFTGLHKGFSPPGTNEASRPEESLNYELGVRYTKNALSGQAIAFFNDYNNLLGSDLAAAGGSGTGRLYNGGEVKAKGLEFEISYDLLSNLGHSRFSIPASFIYTYTDAVFENSFASSFGGWGTVEKGDHLPYLANNQFTVILGLDHRKFNVSLSGKYMDEMLTGPGQGEVPASKKTGAFFVIDASGSYAVHPNVSLFGSVTNLNDQVYAVSRRPAGLRPGMPRAFKTGVKATF